MFEAKAEPNVSTKAADGRNASASGRASRSGHISRARRWVKLAAFLSIVVGLFVGVGWGSFSSTGIDAIASICPLGALETLLAAKAGTPRFLITFAVMVVIVAVFGRAWCSWICPVPPIDSFFHYKKNDKAGKMSAASAESGGQGATPKSADAVLASASATRSSTAETVGPSLSLTAKDKAEIESQAAELVGGRSDKGGCASCGLAPVGGKRDGMRFDTRHGVLAGALIGSLVCGFPVFCLVCPVGLSIATVVAVWQVFWGHAPSWSLVVFPAIVLVEVVFFRKWCHKLCPMGALMSLIGQKSRFQPKVDKGVCLRERGIDCQVCVRSCPELLDPHSARIPECTKCGICVENCPEGAIRMTSKGRAMIDRASA